MTTAVKILSPPLKWAGGKRWLVPRLAEIWKPYSDRVFVDLFCGGLSVTLGLNPERAICNDINPHLINFYQQVQMGLSMDGFMYGNSAEDYAIAREAFNQLIEQGKHESQKAARLFYYLNRTGYNGLCRFNKSGKFNVPVGRYKTINYIQDFSEYKRAISRWEFRCENYSNAAIRSILPGNHYFLVVDPPYDCEFTSYSGNSWQWSDQVALAEWLSIRCCPVVACNAATDRIITLYKGLGFAVELVEAPRKIACNGDRKPVLEMLATKNV